MTNKWLTDLGQPAAAATALAVPAVLHGQVLTSDAGPDWALWASVAVFAVAIATAALLTFRSLRTHRVGRRAADPIIVFPTAAEGDPVPEPTLPQTAAPEPIAAAAPPVEPPRAPEQDTAVVEGRTVRFYRPPEGTLQLLPGRLEIVDGADRGQEIRFVRTRDMNPEITFGRTEGPPHRHIQLRASTVSREHARMLMEGGHWRIANLSRTNPVVVNGEELSASNGGRILCEGDRIEMGEVVFQYREH